MARFAVILPAAGQSSRLAAKDKKPFITLGNQAIWVHAAHAFTSRNDVVQLLVVVAAEDRVAFQTTFAAELTALRAEVVTGGAARCESVANALAYLREDVDFVAIHDAARPLVSAESVNAVFHKAIETGAAILAVPVADTLKRMAADGTIASTLPRVGLWRAQTPQVFRRDWLVAAYADSARLGADVTDDAQLVERLGHPVHLVPGDAINFKITTQQDLTLAAAILHARETLPGSATKPA